MLTSKFENLAEDQHFALGHIPGAVFLDVAGAPGVLSDPDANLPWMWPSQEQVEQAMARYGVAQDTLAIIYAATPRPGIDNGTMWCTRTWWILHHMGVKCAILNGGWEQWLAGNHPVSGETSTAPIASFKTSGDGREAIVSKAQMLGALGNPERVCIVDALAPQSYAGEGHAAYGGRKGHITGAVNVPMSSLLDAATGRFLDARSMTAKLERQGLLSAQRVVTYCGGGIAATVDAFCLALMGHSNVAVYDGSLFEWASDPALPMTDPHNPAR